MATLAALETSRVAARRPDWRISGTIGKSKYDAEAGRTAGCERHREACGAGGRRPEIHERLHLTIAIRRSFEGRILDRHLDDGSLAHVHGDHEADTGHLSPRL